MRNVVPQRRWADAPRMVPRKMLAAFVAVALVVGVAVGAAVLGGAGAKERTVVSCVTVVRNVGSRDGWACGPWTLPAPPMPPVTTTTTSTTTVTTPAGAPMPIGDPGTWRLILDSEFNGTTLQAPWSTGWGGSGITPPVNSEELQCYDPANVTEGGGQLTLSLIAKTESCGGVTRPYVSGMVTTNGQFQFTYGFVEARVWLDGTDTILNWPAVWTDGQSWPTDGELDVVEGLGGAACWHFHSVAGAPGGCVPGSFTGWHTFGADWEPGVVTYFYDGVGVGSVTSGVTGAPMYLILNLASDKLYGGPVWAPSSMRVQYVRVFQH